MRIPGWHFRDHFLLSRWRLRHWPLADHLRTLFERYRIDLVLDVGANTGQYHDFLREHVGFSGQVVSFEPIPRHVTLLEQRSRDAGMWAIYGCALGSAREVRRFQIMDRDQWSSFLPVDDQVASEQVRSATTVSNAVDVQVRTLADLWPELTAAYGNFRPYLKLDTQGFDLEVLAGGAPILAHVPAAQSEIYFQPIYRGAPNYHQSLLAFAEHGFEPAGLFPNTRESSLALRDCDCTFVRSGSSAT
jgi:FkbM family methyltransferase